MTATVTANYVTPDGLPASGRVHFSSVLTTGAFSVDSSVALVAGALSVSLASGTYRVTERIGAASRPPFFVIIQATTATLDLAAATGPAGPAGASGTLVNDWTSGDSGLIARTFDPVFCTVAVAPTVGALYLMSVQVRTAATSAGVMLAQAGAGTNMTAGQNFFALFDSAGTQVAITADLSATLATANQLVNPNWVAPATLPVGRYWVGLLMNSTGAVPTLRAPMSSSTSYILSVNANLTAAGSRFATNGSGLTAMPASIVPASNAGNIGWWAALR